MEVFQQPTEHQIITQLEAGKPGDGVKQSHVLRYKLCKDEGAQSPKVQALVQSILMAKAIVEEPSLTVKALQQHSAVLILMRINKRSQSKKLTKAFTRMVGVTRKETACRKILKRILGRKTSHTLRGGFQTLRHNCQQASRTQSHEQACLSKAVRNISKLQSINLQDAFSKLRLNVVEEKLSMKEEELGVSKALVEARTQELGASEELVLALTHEEEATGQQIQQLQDENRQLREIVRQTHQSMTKE
jgi:hypothetical protein